MNNRNPLHELQMPWKKVGKLLFDTLTLTQKVQQIDNVQRKKKVLKGFLASNPQFTALPKRKGAKVSCSHKSAVLKLSVYLRTNILPGKLQIGSERNKHFQIGFLLNL